MDICSSIGLLGSCLIFLFSCSSLSFAFFTTIDHSPISTPFVDMYFQYQKKKAHKLFKIKILSDAFVSWPRNFLNKVVLPTASIPTNINFILNNLFSLFDRSLRELKKMGISSKKDDGALALLERCSTDCCGKVTHQEAKTQFGKVSM